MAHKLIQIKLVQIKSGSINNIQTDYKRPLVRLRKYNLKLNRTILHQISRFKKHSPSNASNKIPIQVSNTFSMTVHHPKIYSRKERSINADLTLKKQNKCQISTCISLAEESKPRIDII